MFRITILFTMFLGLSGAFAGTPRLLEDRGPIQTLDLFWGGSSPERAPKPPFTFISENVEGSNPKMVVTDSTGAKFGVKFDEEVPGEVAATRLAWAVGLRVEETYYVSSGQVKFGRVRPEFQRLSGFLDSKGNIKKPARFERKLGNLNSTKVEWEFGRNPFSNTPEIGVPILMNVIMSNWDSKPLNNKVFSLQTGNGIEDWYMIADFGACFGKMGGSLSHKKYDLKSYSQEPPVIQSISGNTVYLNYKGKDSQPHEQVSLEQARYFVKRVEGLTLAQIEDAFRAADEVNERAGFARVVYNRIQEVVQKVNAVK